MSDIGVSTSSKICFELRKTIKLKDIKEPTEIINILKEIINNILSGNNDLKLDTNPSIILVIGVNGVGKTTTIGKLACKFKSNNKKVLISAADTFRAAAVEQLQIWANKANCDILRRPENSDPASVIFDSINVAKFKKTDIIICDTAGRLHNKSNLMAELSKIGRITDRELSNHDKEILLVLDATTGQNGLIQAQEFKKILDITGIIVTKLDGTAKGGIILSIKDQLNIPVKFIGIGEHIEDLQKFEAEKFTEALFDNF
ncbi:MAG: signal recognition particle-docking protein FtsY [Candidatus Paraimprobicoccus trichonymphae]|uniref:Signal recognition particle receptor FtsY n=1 Tax=Candidatus Paraimprobicoccus trichonymphae TaxID=3033793 RepID=A0AA48I2P4_9FIRM|nr:MAG: signal recognition particle-docking protein FtsY [Candidatus Paraimprobicoccus trichonymphae]